jgi:MGT family glycosyltransferase
MALISLPGKMLLQSGQTLRIISILASGLPHVIDYARTARRLQQATGQKLPPLTDVINWPGDLNISYTSRLIQPDADKLGSTYRFVGPPIAPRMLDPDFSWEKIDASRPLVYVSLGTVFNDNMPFYRLCLQALADAPYQVVMSIGRHVDSAELGSVLPANFIVQNHVPQLALLAHVDLFVTHAGMNSVNEGLYFDVPLLLVPQQLEQALVAARIVRLGAGVVLKDGKVSAESLRQTVTTLLADGALKAAARQVGDSLRNAGGVQAAVSAIEQFAGET